MRRLLVRYPRKLFLLGLLWIGLFAPSAIAAPGAAAPGAASVQIDLNSLDAWVRPGFSIEWAYYVPDPKDKAWTRIPAKPGDRPLIYRDLPLQGGTRRGRFAVAPAPADTFCVIFAFQASAELLSTSSGTGLLLGDIGKNWDVYLNGSVIQHEVRLGKGGIIETERAVHGALVDIDRRFLKEGTNILAFSIIGDRQDYRTGLFSRGPYLIGPFVDLLKAKSEYIDLMLIGIYFFFGLYHLILFGIRPANRQYLYYGLGTLFLAFYLFSRTFLVYSLIQDTALIRSMELASLFIFFPLFIAFFDESNRSKVSLFTRLFSAYSLAVALVSPFIWGELILKLWQTTLPVFVVYLLAFDFIIPIKQALSASQGGRPRDRLRILYRLGDFWTIALVGIIVLMCAIAAFSDLNSPGALSAAKVGAFFVVFGTATVLAGKFTSLFRDVEDFNAGLSRRVSERTSALESAMAEQSKLNESLQAANDRLQGAMDDAARDTKIAVQVQQGMFPQKPPEVEDWDLAFVYLPVQGVSGDLYDFYVDEGRLSGALVGDVSGHGIASGLITVLARSIFYRGFRGLSKYSLGRIIEEINGELSGELSQVENYLTVNLLRFEGDTVEYANAGHTELAFRRAGKAKASFITPEEAGDFKGPPLGREGLEAPYRSLKFKVRPGDTLLLYTDCLLEARNEEGQPFGSEGLLSAYGRAPDDSAADMLQYIIEDWRFHLGDAEVADDFTAMLLKRK